MDFSWFCMLVLVLVAFFIDYGGAQNQCKELRCGHNSPPIRFPFRVKDQQPNYCGYPGFDLSCSDKHETVLELPTPAKFSVRKIDYESQEIEVYDPYNCLLGKLLKNLDLTNSPFHVPKDIPSDYTLFNCSTLDRKNLDGLVPCLSGSAYQIYMVDSYTSIEYLPLVYCTKMYNASNVPFSIYRSSYDNLLLKWYEPNCGPCEAKGNQCGLKKNGTKLETECLDLKKSKGNIVSFHCMFCLLRFIKPSDKHICVVRKTVMGLTLFLNILNRTS